MLATEEVGYKKEAPHAIMGSCLSARDDLSRMFCRVYIGGNLSGCSFFRDQEVVECHRAFQDAPNVAHGTPLEQQVDIDGVAWNRQRTIPAQDQTSAFPDEGVSIVVKRRETRQEALLPQEKLRLRRRQAQRLPGPSDEEVAGIVEAVAQAVICELRAHRYLAEEMDEVLEPSSLDPVFAASAQLAAAVSASAVMRIAFGERAGLKVRRIEKGFGFEDETPYAKGKRCFSANSFTIHANRYIVILKAEHRQQPTR